jgi:predicted nucleotidyltransferase
MRLQATEMISIKACAERHFGPYCVVRIFGSRVDDARRGGDIDIHVTAPDDEAAGLARRIAYIAELETLIGEREVDVVVEGPSRKNGYIDQVARDTGVAL